MPPTAALRPPLPRRRRAAAHAARAGAQARHRVQQAGRSRARTAGGFFADTISIAVGEKAGIRRKPAPDTLLAAMAQLGADPASTVYVGDSEVDIATARAAGLPCISVLWGFRDRDVLERAGAQQFAADIAQLQALLG